MLKPYGKHILVQLETKTQTNSGLYIPETTFQTEVVVGTIFDISDQLYESNVAKGKKVWFTNIGTYKVSYEGKDYRIVPEACILGLD